MYLGQDAADYGREWPTKTTRVTFLRIPIGFEYIQPLANGTNLYVGGGPDILHTANDITETNVGMHVATRIHHAFDERFGAALEVGYMWGYLNNPGKDVNLSNAYVTPSVTYDF